ncbi:MAG: ATP-binding protein [Burkholderiaceae bacterium]
MSEASPTEGSTHLSGSQRQRQVRQLTAVVGAVFWALGLANLLRGELGQAAILLLAALSSALALWQRTEQRWPGQALALTVLSIAVVASCTWLGDGLFDSGNYAYPAVLGMASLVLDRRGFAVCTLLVTLALGALGWADASGWWHWDPPASGWWHVLDMVAITGASAAIAGLIMLDMRRTLSDMRVRDIALRSANERLAASEGRLRELFETAPIGLLRLGADGRIAEVNGALAALLGREPAMLRHMRPQRLTHPEDWPRLHEALADTGRAPLAEALELRLQRPDGGHLRARVRLGPMATSLGSGGGTLLSVEDVTQAHRILQLERDKAAAEATSRAQTDFLSRMSHELRTPLNAMLGYAQLMREDAQAGGDPQLRHRLQVVEGAGWHLAAMINDILDLSRLEAGHLPLKLEPVALDPLVDEALAMIAGEAAPQQIALARDASAEPGLWAMTDPTRLRQVLANLLSNAVKYNRAGGWVRLGLRALAPGGGDEPHVEIEVRDNGLGFTPDQLGHLFEPFNRLGREASSRPGTGIGLVIARGLVELMGGTLTVESEPGEGSRFVVVLPRVASAAPPASPDADAEAEPAAPAPATAASPAHDGPCGPRRVVYIEDNPVNCEIMRAILHARPQIELQVHEDGEDGLAAVLAAPPDLLLLDLQLGATSGLDLLAALRRGARTARLPVLVVSADVLPATREAVLAAGALGFVAKPLSLADTLRAVDEALADAEPDAEPDPVPAAP